MHADRWFSAPGGGAACSFPRRCRTMRAVWLMGVTAWLAGGMPAAETSAGSATAYETLIAPIFRARCIECHGEHKQKAKLALHAWDAVLRGSEAGPVFVAGQPDESVLIERLRRPVADDEHMPPEDRPQPGPEEIALLE